MRRLTALAVGLMSALACAPAGPAAPVVRLADEPGMVIVPSGTFRMGTADGPDDEQPVHEVDVAAFAMDQHEVTVGEFRRFVSDTGYRTEAETLGWAGVFDVAQAGWTEGRGATWRAPEGPAGPTPADDEPVTQVSWRDASAYARWAGKRLPTEAEWEFAARGGVDQAPYVWGHDLRPGGHPVANWWQGMFPGHDSGEDGYRGRAPVGRFPANGYGLRDMTGNVWEWCADWYDEAYYTRTPRMAPRGPDGGTERVLRGGSWLCSEDFCSNYRPGARMHSPPDSGLNNVGFRLVKDLAPPAAAQGTAAARATTPAIEWPVYGGSNANDRYSPLSQITPANVATLEEAWRFDTGESGGFQVNPLVVRGVVYSPTPNHRVVAIDAATGALRWTFDAKIESRGPNRGLTYWEQGDERRLFAAVDQYLYCLDANTGVPVPAFGEQGRIDLRRGLGRDPAAQSIRLTSPGLVYRNLLIIGGRAGEGVGASPGDIRALDVRTGAVRWTFHTIPRPGEPGYKTWGETSWQVNGGANNWAGMALDERRGLVFVPTGSAAPDFHGADRPGDNLYANTLLALDAATGAKRWHFQAVHHDIWDRDFPSPPTLVTVRRNGRAIDAVAQTTKHGYVFVLDRETGTPLFPVEERAVPASTIASERASRTQPVPVRPEPFARQRLTADLLTTRTPAAHAWAAQAFAAFHTEGPFTPLRLGQDTVVFPGFDGGAEWGGSAFDPASGRLFVNANDIAWTGSLAPEDTGTDGRSVYLQSCATCHRDDRRGAPPQIPALTTITATPEQLTATIRQGAGRMPGFPNLSPDALRALIAYLRDTPGHGEMAAPAGGAPAPRPPAASGRLRFTGYKKFLDPDGYPAVAPPWGTLNAIDLNTGAYAWRIPLGEYPELAAQGLANTGTENYGGPIVTASGVLFIGATNFDRKFRAFDAASGRLLWQVTLPFAANTTPATYEVAGRQYVVVAAGGGKSKDPSGGMFIAYRLPRDAQRGR